MNWILTGLNFRSPFLFILNRRQPGFSYVISLSLCRLAISIADRIWCTHEWHLSARSDIRLHECAWFPRWIPRLNFLTDTQFGSRFNRVYVGPPRTPANLISIRKGSGVPWVLGGTMQVAYMLSEKQDDTVRPSEIERHSGIILDIVVQSHSPCSLILFRCVSVLANVIFFYPTFIERV